MAFLPAGATPLPTLPVSLRSRCQLSVVAPFLMVKAKMPLPCLMAASFSVSRALAKASKAAEDGILSGERKRGQSRVLRQNQPH